MVFQENNMQENAIRSRKRNTLTYETLKNIFSMLKNNKSAKEMSKDLNLSLATIYNMVEKISRTDGTENSLRALLGQLGRKRRGLSEAQSILAHIVQEDPSLTQRGMQECLQARGFYRSQSMISNYLKELCLTRKRAIKFGDKRNSADVISQRKNYSIRTRLIDDSRILFLDETGFNLHSSSNYAYSPVNTPARIIVPTSRGKNISILAMISNTGIINFKCINGSVNSESLVEFLDDSLQKNIITNKTVIMDNVRFHKSNETITFLTNQTILYGFLPPYSPELNPIEEVFSALKSRYYNVRPRARNYNEVVRNIEIIIEEMNMELNFQNFYNNMRKYLDKAFSGGHF